MSELFAPKQLSSSPEPIDLTGMIFPWKDDQPVLFRMLMCDDNFLTCFTSEEKLLAFMKRMNAPFDKIKLIPDGPVFIEENLMLLQTLKIAVDPWFTLSGTIRYTQVMLPALD